MIKKLRHQFILVNMLLVTLVLLIVFGVLVPASHRPGLRRHADGPGLGKQQQAAEL